MKSIWAKLYPGAILISSIKLLKQPKSLNVYVFTEMWERYGFYTLLSLLIFYFIHFFHLNDQLSYNILGSITALAYGHSVIGGYIADRLLGHRTSVLFATVLLSVGYSLIALFPNLTAVYWALSLITVGTGMLKPNISSLVGFLYNVQDVRRHSGYTIFFVGINIGIILGETLAGLIQRYFGWKSLFFTASVSLIIACCTFWIGTHLFNIKDQPLQNAKRKKRLGSLMLVLAISVSYYIISHPTVSTIFFSIVAIFCLGVILYNAYQEEKVTRKKLIAFLLLMVISTLYWAFYFQMFFSFNVFIERIVDRHVWGLTLIPSIYPSIEAMGVILFGIGLSWGWRWLESTRPHLNPNIPIKFTLALGIHTIALGILYYASLIIGTNLLILQSWLISAYLLIAIGELLISPIGLAMVVEFVPRHSVGLMMGIFFMTQGLGSKLSGIAATITSIPENIVQNSTDALRVYQHGFLIYFLLSIVGTLISYSLVSVIKKLTTTGLVDKNRDLIELVT